MTEPHMENEETLEGALETGENAEINAAATRIAELEKQVAELKDRALREMAEAENTRRRAQKEREETSKYAVANFAREMLAVADNFARALEATPKDSADPSVKNLVAGIEATERQLVNTLAQFGVKKMEVVGLPFDPNFHRVMTEVETTDQAAGTIVQVLQAGYVIHDRLLREALVAVAKGASNITHIDKSA